MDQSLLQSLSSFQKHASRTVPVTHKSQLAAENSHSTYNPDAAKKKKKASSSIPQKANLDFDFKNVKSHSNAANFGTMAKIVDYMKKRHLEQKQWGLKLQEILDELQIYDLSKKAQQWLVDALPGNPRLQCDEEGKFTYQPPFKIKGKTSLVSVAKKHHLDAKGGILLTQLNECVPNGEKLLDILAAEKELIVVPTQVNKKKDKVFFYNDPTEDIEMDEEFRQLWRNIAMDHLDEKKIEEYLQKRGIDAMKDLTQKKFVGGPPKRKTPKRRFNAKIHNEHLNNVLEDYDNE